MRIRILPLAILAAVVGGALAAGGARADKIYTVTSTVVHNSCRGRLQSGGGQTGCNRCDGGVCRDYNCSDGSNGVPKGCREIIINGRGPARHPVWAPSSGINQQGGHNPPQHHRNPVKLGGFAPSRPGNKTIGGDRQPVMVMHAAGHSSGGGRR